MRAANPRETRLADADVMTKKMMRIFLILAILTASMMACSRGDRVSMGSEHPILQMEVVGIPSTGNVSQIDGYAEILLKGAKQYQKLRIHDTVNEADIIFIKKESKVNVNFSNGTLIINQAQTKDTFVTFEFLRPSNKPDK